MKLLIGGIVILLLGLWGLIGWWGEFVDILQGAMPFLLLVGGSVAVYAGISSIKDEAADKKEEEMESIERAEEEFTKEKERKGKLEKEEKEENKKNKKVVKKKIVKKKKKEEK